jgi:hypothetical protein
MGGHERDEITEDTVPIGQLPGFDSLTGIEFTVMVGTQIALDKSVTLCVHNNKPSNVGQIVDRLVKICADQEQGEQNGEEGQQK